MVTAACGGGGSADSGSGPIKVGSILDETGPLNIYGTAMSDATKLANWAEYSGKLDLNYTPKIPGHVVLDNSTQSPPLVVHR